MTALRFSGPRPPEVAQLPSTSLFQIFLIPISPLLTTVFIKSVKSVFASYSALSSKLVKVYGMNLSYTEGHYKRHLSPHPTL